MNLENNQLRPENINFEYNKDEMNEKTKGATEGIRALLNAVYYNREGGRGEGRSQSERLHHTFDKSNRNPG